METLNYWFNKHLTGEEKQKALENTPPHRLGRETACLSDAISTAFIWVETPEGHLYWSGVHNRARGAEKARSWDEDAGRLDSGYQ